MRKGVRLGHLAGIPVSADWSVAVTLAIVVWLLVTTLPTAVPRQPGIAYWGIAVAAAVTFLAALLAHELAHALVARRNGMKVRSVTLWMLGGMTELAGDPPNPGADLRIALAGPGASATLALLFAGLAVTVGYADGPRLAAASLTWLAFMNGVLAVFNLIPGAPLDGGRVLRAVLWHRWGDRLRAERGAATAGRTVGIGIAMLGIVELLYDPLGGLWLIMIGWFMASAASAERRAAGARAALAGVRVADVMIRDPDPAGGWTTVADFIELLTLRPATCDAFPVIGLGGDLIGVVTVGQLGRIPPASRPHTSMRDIALTVPAEYVSAPEDPAAPLLSRDPLGGEVSAVVLSGGRVVGLVTATGLRRELRWRELASSSA